MQKAEYIDSAEKIKELEKSINEKYSLEQVLQIPSIKNARDSYKKLGKDPSRYRLACESLFRRLVKGNGLYRVSNVVDAGNVLSIELAKSTAVLDYDKLQGDIHIRIGTNDEFGQSGTAKELMSLYGLNAEKLAEKITGLIK